MGQANILRGAQVQNLEFLIKNSFVLPHQDFTSFRLLRFQIRYVREKISMGDHGYLHGGMVAPSWRGMQFLRFGGGIARRYIDGLVANHNGEEEDYSWNSELERLLRNLVVSLSPLHHTSLVAFQTTEQYRVEYDSRRGKEYSRFHGYSYDGIWAVALAIQRVASRITHYRRNQTMSDFRYRDELWEKLFLEALRNTSFEGVTVGIFWTTKESYRIGSLII